MKKAIFLVLLIGLCLRLINLDQSFWLDEAAQALMSSRSPVQIIFDRANDFHPPFFYLLAHFWIHFNSSEIWLRTLPVLFGLVSIPLLILVSKELFGMQPKIKISKLNFSPQLYSGLLLAVAPFHVYYSQEFRSYSLLVFLVLLSFWSAVKIFRLESLKYWIAFTLANAGILYSHYSGIFYIASIVGYIFFVHPKLRRSLIFSIFSMTLLFTPWLPQFFRQVGFAMTIGNYLPGWEQMLNLSPFRAIPILIFKLVAGRIDVYPQWAYGAYALYVLAFTMLTLLFVRLHSKLIYSLVFGPIILIILTSLVVPQTQPFRLIFVLPFICLALTAAAIRHPKTVTIGFLYICVFGNLMQFTRPRLMREEWRQAADFLTSSPKLTVVKFPEVFAPLVWYSPHLNYLSIMPAAPTEETSLESLKDRVSSESSLYVLEYLTDISDPNRQVESLLTELGFSEKNTSNFEGVGFIKSFERGVY